MPLLVAVFFFMINDRAEREGFEPSISVSRYNGFRDRRIQPLCHLSKNQQGKINKINFISY